MLPRRNSNAAIPNGIVCLLHLLEDCITHARSYFLDNEFHTPIFYNCTFFLSFLKKIAHKNALQLQDKGRNYHKRRCKNHFPFFLEEKNNKNKAISYSFIFRRIEVSYFVICGVTISHDQPFFQDSFVCTYLLDLDF